MKKFWDRLAQGVKDRMFPIHCAGCAKEGEWWCAACRKESGIAVANNNLEAVSSLNGVTALFNYGENSSLAKLIWRYKYQYARDIEEVWQEIILEHFPLSEREKCLPSAAVFIPVPLHPRRERERGFNQAAALARLFTGYSCGEINCDNLIRSRYTTQQAKLSGEDRRKNMINAFNWRGRDLPSEKIILVDDIFTTGATMQECAKVLKQAGAKFVWGLVLARG